MPDPVLTPPKVPASLLIAGLRSEVTALRAAVTGCQDFLVRLGKAVTFPAPFADLRHRLMGLNADILATKSAGDGLFDTTGPPPPGVGVEVTWGQAAPGNQVTLYRLPGPDAAQLAAARLQGAQMFRYWTEGGFDPASASWLAVVDIADVGTLTTMTPQQLASLTPPPSDEMLGDIEASLFASGRSLASHLRAVQG